MRDGVSGWHSWLRSAGAAALAVVTVLMLSGAGTVAASPHWTLVSSPDSGTGKNVLNGVSCASATFCMAVGYYVGPAVGGQDLTLALEWNGTSWATVRSPDPGSVFNYLWGVQCTSATFCVAVGYYAIGDSGAYRTLILEWNGTSWTRVSSPDASSTRANFLSGVACSSARFCMAVGAYINGSGGDQTLILEWNGTRWTRVSSPDASRGYNFLTGAKCPSTSFCMAVGEYVKGSKPQQTLTEKWNGTSWALVSSPDPGINDNSLSGVTCTSATFCMASGNYYPGGPEAGRALILEWNGTRWIQVNSPDASSYDNSLPAVRCPSTRFCMTVGAYSPNGSVGQTLAEKWNGTSWTLVSSPNTSATMNNDLEGLSCTSTTFCMAVGTQDTSVTIQTLTEKW